MNIKNSYQCHEVTRINIEKFTARNLLLYNLF